MGRFSPSKVAHYSYTEQLDTPSDHLGKKPDNDYIKERNAYFEVLKMELKEKIQFGEDWEMNPVALEGIKVFKCKLIKS